MRPKSVSLGARLGTRGYGEVPVIRSKLEGCPQEVCFGLEFLSLLFRKGGNFWYLKPMPVRGKGAKATQYGNPRFGACLIVPNFERGPC